MNEDKKLKHLELIQGAVNRMSGNLFTLRGWVITLIVGLAALFLEFGRSELLIILGLVIIIFWIHDAYFLAMERRFRSLYNHVRKLEESKIDFSMDTSSYEKLAKNTVLYCMFSKTLVFFYVPTIVLLVLINVL